MQTTLVRPPAVKRPGLSRYLLLLIVGWGIILFCSLFQHIPSEQGEYHYSQFFRGNFLAVPALIIFFIVGLAVGYFWNLSPWLTTLCLYFSYPVAVIIEGTVYRGSHNLLPIELIFFFVFTIPCVVAVYIGRFMGFQIAKRKE